VTALADLLIELGAAGVTLWVRRGKLRGHCTDEQALRIKPHREVLLSVLTGYVPTGAEEAYVFQERLGVAEERGMLTEPGSPGWLIAVGEAIRAEEAAQAARPPLEITPQRLDAWEAYAGGEGDACAKAARFMDEVWRRVHRLEHKGVERADAIAVALAAMEASKVLTPVQAPASGGIVTLSGVGYVKQGQSSQRSSTQRQRGGMPPKKR
jgi:hypothetical protein